MTSDDIPAVVAFNTPDDFRVGMLWSNQVSPKHFAWTSHKDGDPETVWNPASPLQLVSGSPPPPTYTADDHIHLTVTPGQAIVAATKATEANSIHVRIRPYATTDAWGTRIWSAAVLRGPQ